MTYRKKNLDNRVIDARFPSVCGETGQIIAKGEKCFYMPYCKQVFSLDSKTYQDWAELEFDHWLCQN